MYYVRYIADSKGKYMAVRSRIFHLPPLFPVNPAPLRCYCHSKNFVGFQQNVFLRITQFMTRPNAMMIG